MRDLSGLTTTVDSMLAVGVPFAAYALPGEGKYVFVRNREDGPFRMVPWSSDSPTGGAVWNRSTPRGEYDRAVEAIKNSHTPESGKTVLSRAICGRLADGRSFGGVFADLLGRFPDTLRYIAWSPGTGGWLGATPEVLGSLNGDVFRTMALAGTRPAAECGPWDEKNLREHRMVSDFIIERIQAHGAQAMMDETAEMPYGEITHLCTPISAIMPSDLTFDALLRDLHPTPAVAGTPRDRAIRAIAALEAHPRRYYAGYIVISDTDGLRDAFVNLRCLNFDPVTREVCIYAGGGITALSDPQREWDEARRKAQPLIDLVFDNYTE